MGLWFNIVAAFFGVFFLAVGFNLMRHEWRRYHQEKEEMPAFALTQLIRRQAGAVIIGVLGLMFFFGLGFPYTLTPTPQIFFRYWGAFCGLILVLMILAGWDFYAARQAYRKHAKDVIKKVLFETPPRSGKLPPPQ